MENSRDKAAEEKRAAVVALGRLPVVGILLLGVGMSAALVWYSFQQRRAFSDSITEQFQRHQETIAAGVARGVEGMILRVTGYMEALAASPEVGDPDSKVCRERIQEFYFANQDVIYAGYRMNEAGVLVYMYPIDERGLNSDISGQEHVKRLLETRELVVSGLFSSVEGFDAVAIHAPVFRAGKFDGSVATIIPMTKIAQVFVGRVRSGRKGFAWLVDENGTILDYPEDEYIGKKLAGTDIFPAGVLGELQKKISKGETAAMKLGDTLFAISPTRLGDRVWTVILSTPYEDISEPITRQWRRQWLVNLAVFAMLVIVISVLFVSGARALRLEREKSFLEERIALQEELRESRDRLDMTLRTVPSGLYTVDRDGIILSWNRTAERLLGYTAEEIIGKPCSTFSKDDKCGKCSLFSADVPKPIYGTECWLTAKTGERILASKNLDYIRDSAGATIGGIESFVDITAARRAENERLDSVSMEKEIEHLRKMDGVKSNFLSMVSHELRTPLSVMLGNLAMARKGKYGGLSSELEAKLDVVLRRGWQLNDLIANLLDLAKIESGKLDLKKESVYVWKAAEEVLAELRDEIEKKALDVDVGVSRSAVVWADPSMFHRLLENLVSNAVKFSSEGGGIAVSCREEGGFLAVSVKDNGAGIPESALPRVFDRFYQVDDSSTRKHGGTGLGLSIAKEIMEVHKGRMEIKSRVGEGTEALAFFPLEEPPPDEKELSARASESVRKLPTPYFNEPRTFLYVGTDPEFLTALTVIFENTSHRVISIPEHGAAAHTIEKEHVAVVILDVDAPGAGDRDFGLWKKLVEDGYRLLVISVSESETVDKHRLAGLSASACLLRKPLDREEFISSVKNHLE